MNSKIMQLIDQYSDKHPLSKEVGSEYIYQNDEAQVDAVDLVSNIFDILSDKESSKQISICSNCTDILKDKFQLTMLDCIEGQFDQFVKDISHPSFERGCYMYALDYRDEYPPECIQVSIEILRWMIKKYIKDHNLDEIYRTPHTFTRIEVQKIS